MKASEHKARAMPHKANASTPATSLSDTVSQFSDNRPEAATQRALKNQISSASESIQKVENNTGLPDHLKSGIESLSGHSMDDVTVHYNSSKPAQLNAHAYAQGTDIHVASGQEKHLPHEAWHVVQQKQGRVQPTMQLQGGVNVNDDVVLEKEADVMGDKATKSPLARTMAPGLKEPIAAPGATQLHSANTIQRAWIELDPERHMWDRVRSGLRWFCNPTTGAMWFEIIDLREIEDEDAQGVIDDLRTYDMTYDQWLDVWRDNDWSTDDTAVLEAEMEPKETPHYRQWSPDSCNIEAIRMVYETQTGIRLARGELTELMRDQDVSWRPGQPFLFSAIPAVVQRGLNLLARALRIEGLDELVPILDMGAVVLLEIPGHVLVIDSTELNAEGQRVFAIRDPDGLGVEQVQADDARLVRFTGNIIKVL